MTVVRLIDITGRRLGQAAGLGTAPREIEARAAMSAWQPGICPVGAGPGAVLGGLACRFMLWAQATKWQEMSPRD